MRIFCTPEARAGRCLTLTARPLLSLQLSLRAHLDRCRSSISSPPPPDLRDSSSFEQVGRPRARPIGHLCGANTLERSQARALRCVLPTLGAGPIIKSPNTHCWCFSAAACIAAPLDHALYELLARVFRGRTSLRARIAEVVAALAIILPIQNTVYRKYRVIKALRVEGRPDGSFPQSRHFPSFKGAGRSARYRQMSGASSSQSLV